MRRLLLSASLALALGGPARAVTPDEQLADPALEARARSISQELRCVVCQNQSIDESDAPLAHDLRVLLRERLAGGDTDAEAKAFIVDRYGAFVLLRPPLKPETWLLWFGPLGLLAAGGIGVFFYIRGRAAATPPDTLDPTEAAEVEKLLSSDEAA